MSDMLRIDGIGHRHSRSSSPSPSSSSRPTSAAGRSRRSGEMAECSSASMEENRVKPIDNSIRDFRPLLEARGMHVEQSDASHVLRELQTRDDVLRTTVVQSTDGPSRFSSEVFVRLWGGAGCTTAFPGSSSHLDLLLGHVHPTALSLPVGHVSLDHLPELMLSLFEWGVASGPLADAIDFYLSRAVEVPASRKLLVASVTGSELLLESTLHNDCGKAEAITEISDSPSALDPISAASKGCKVMKRMLQHSSKCADETYLNEELKPRFDRLLNECRDRLRLVDGLGASTTVHCGDNVGLTAANRTFYCNRWVLAMYSPVLRRMLFGEFVESRKSVVSVFDGNETVPARGILCFLSLLQPTGVNALWWLCPKEITELDWRNPHPIVDELFDLIFDGSLEILMDVFQLAHQFQVTKLMRFCELLIDNKSDSSLAYKLHMADMYHLPDLMARCLARLTTPETFKREVYETDGDLINKLNPNTVKLLLDRLMQMV